MFHVSCQTQFVAQYETYSFQYQLFHTNAHHLSVVDIDAEFLHLHHQITFETELDLFFNQICIVNVVYQFASVNLFVERVIFVQSKSATFLQFHKVKNFDVQYQLIQWANCEWSVIFQSFLM